MPIIALSPIKHFRLLDADSIPIDTNVIVNNTPNTDLDALLDFNFRQYIGSMGVSDFMQKWGVAIYRYNEPAPITDEVALSEVNYAINLIKVQLHAFDTFLWFAKDNSVYSQIQYGHFLDAESLRGFSTNAQSSEINSNVLGKFEDVSFSLHEVKYCLSILNIYAETEFKFNARKIVNTKEELNEYLETRNGKQVDDYNSYSRIRRALEFIRSARSLHYMPAKIGAYISFFESLFSEGPESVNYKVGERLACYLYSDPIKRLDIFDRLRKIYNIRSKYVHGSKLEVKQSKLSAIEDACTDLDVLARLTLTKVILEDSEHFLQNDDLYFLFLKQIVLGNSPHKTLDSNK